MLPDLRERSRQEYLRKREEQQLLLLEQKLKDEEFLFQGVELTEKEKRELEYNRQVLQLAKERLSISDKVDGYHMPEDYITEKGKLDKKKQESVLYRRYEDAEGGYGGGLATGETTKFVSEQEQWENEQISKSLLKVGAKDKPVEEDVFEYVFDEEQQIDFILESTVKSKGIDEDVAPELDAATKKREWFSVLSNSTRFHLFTNQLLL